MIRNLKALGLALVAVFAMSIVAASAAQAAEFTAGAYPATVDGTQIEGKHIFTVGPLSTECETATFSSESVAKETPTLTLTPTYSSCVAHASGKTFPVTVTMNGCDFLFHATKEGSTYFAHTDVVCPVGSGPIEVHVYSNSTHTAETSVCTYTIGAQTGLTGITLTNTGSDVTADISVSDITNITRHIGVKGNSATCGLNEHPSGTYSGKATLTATSGGGTVSASVSG